MSIDYPDFLQDQLKFKDHTDSNLSQLSAPVKGQHFADFVEGILKISALSDMFDHTEQTKPSHDEGVDIFLKNNKGKTVGLVESKYSIPDQNMIGKIFDNFSNFENKYIKQNQGDQGVLFEQQKVDKPIYVIVTLSLLNDSMKLKNYVKTERASVTFYNQLINENRLMILDLKDLFEVSQNAYAKRHFLPKDIEISFVSEILVDDSVYVGLIDGNQIKSLYKSYGDGLFLENIREWLGPKGPKKEAKGRERVNQAIANTIIDAPQQFLSKNNGLTIRASKVSKLSVKSLKLGEGSIVNGCQTTMSIVHSEVDVSQCHVLVKIVETSDAWDIAASSNFQNEVNQINLKISKYIRPQLLKSAADSAGYSVGSQNEKSQSIFDIFHSISHDRIVEEEIRATFLGLFSLQPKNALTSNYTDLRHDLLSDYDENIDDKQRFWDAVFTINAQTQRAAVWILESSQENSRRQDLVNLFKRFLNHDKAGYRAYLVILAMCVVSDINPFSLKQENTLDNILKIIYDSERLVLESPEKFNSIYQDSLKAIALNLNAKSNDQDGTKRDMFKHLQSINFQKIFMSVD